MRVRAAQKFSFDHSRNNKIAGVPGLSRNLLGAVNALHRGADDRIALNLQVTTFLFAQNPSESCLRRDEDDLTVPLSRDEVSIHPPVYWR
jgi:hypothetical protein